MSGIIGRDWTVSDEILGEDRVELRITGSAEFPVKLAGRVSGSDVTGGEHLLLFSYGRDHSVRRNEITRDVTSRSVKNVES